MLALINRQPDDAIHTISVFHSTSHPLLLGGQVLGAMWTQSLPKDSTHDQCRVSNHRPLDDGSNALTTLPRIPHGGVVWDYNTTLTILGRGVKCLVLTDELRFLSTITEGNDFL